MFLYINRTYDNCKIHLIWGENDGICNETQIPKCNEFNFGSERYDCYHLKFPFNSSNYLLIASEGDCSGLNGVKNAIEFKVISINHTNEYMNILSIILSL